MTRRLLDITKGVHAQPEGVPAGYHVAALPPELLDWLADLLVLRGVPLTYLVPRPELLPPESVRFFHIDPNFTAQMIAGAIAAADLGSFDRAIRRPIADALREQAEARLAERIAPHEQDPVLPQLSGFLLRSELVRRWPGMLVTGWQGTDRASAPLLLARKERLAAGLLIVVFAGVPKRVEIAEPPEGTRFGAEQSGNAWQLKLRAPDGAATITLPVTVSAPARKLDITKLAADAKTVGSGHLSLCLQQTSYVQVFQGSGAHERKRIRRVRAHLSLKDEG